MSYQMQGPMGAKTVINGRSCDYFAGCGYLGLQNHPDVLQAAATALQQFGLANAGGLGNNHPLYQELAQAARAFFAVADIRYFASGYLGNLMLLQGLNKRYERIFIDNAAHYSVWDGARSSGKPIVPFHHLSPDDLSTQLKEQLRPGERPLLLTDGVFPVSGEIAPLPAYLEILHPYNGLTCLDDAHASGVLGANGRGTMEYFGLTAENCFACHTLSKALGAYGGLIGGSQVWIDEIEQHSHVSAGASLPPLPVTAAARCALQLAQEPQRRQTLWQNVALARAGFRQSGWELPETPVPILCLPARPGLDLVQLQTQLFAQNIAVAYSQNYSSTPKGGALRIAIFATHTADQIHRLITTVQNLL